MTEEQAQKIIELLEAILNKLENGVIEVSGGYNG